jgi:release factor glutamine methyltransferase
MNAAARREQVGALWRQAGARIGRLDARLLLDYLGLSTHAELIAHPERELAAEQVAQFEALVARREAGEPLAYLLGSAFFYGLEFAVSSAVLIPRPDTEVLVDQALARAQEVCQQRAAPRIVDLGTGSGIVAILLARRCPPLICRRRRSRWRALMRSGTTRPCVFSKATGMGRLAPSAST